MDLHALRTLSRPVLSALLALAMLSTATPACAQDADSTLQAPAGEDATRDLETGQRLARRLQEIDGMEAVTVVVQGGVARLEGTVVDVNDRVLAAQVAGQQPGITSVDNRVALSTRLSDRFSAALRQVVEKLVRLAAAIPLLLVAIAVVAVAWWLGRLLGQRFERRRWRSGNPYIAGLAQRVAQWLTLLVGLLIALDLLGATALVGAVLGSAGVVGLVLGFAFKDIAENYVAGVLLSLRRPFAPGELLRIDSYEGKVAALTSRAVILVTLDGNRLSLPNALVFKSVVLNFTRNPLRRLDFVIPIDTAESIRQAQALAMQAIGGIDGVLADPGPSWTVKGYEAGGLDLQFFAWVDQRESDLGKVRSEAIHAVRTAFATAGVESPRAIQYVAPLADDTPAAGSGIHAEAAPAPADTSVNRDIDAQVAAEQRAHAGQDLIHQDDGRATGPS